MTVKRNRKTHRNNQICALRRIGISYRLIAWQYGISIIRVRQIIEAQGAADERDKSDRDHGDD